MLTVEEIKDAFARSLPIELGDPVLLRFPLPLSQTFYPLGFPVQVETNCEEVLRCAAASWQGFVKLFDTEAIRIRVGVRGGRSSACPPTPVCRVQQHLATNIADGENFSVTDLSRGFAYIWITEAALAHRNYFSYFFLESSAMAILATSHTTAVHAACVERNGCGILLCGDSGAGKSSLSYACARAGWTYITDDASFLINHRSDRLVVGNCNLGALSVRRQSSSSPSSTAATSSSVRKSANPPSSWRFSRSPILRFHSRRTSIMSSSSIAATSAVTSSFPFQPKSPDTSCVKSSSVRRRSLEPRPR